LPIALIIFNFFAIIAAIFSFLLLAKYNNRYINIIALANIAYSVIKFLISFIIIIDFIIAYFRRRFSFFTLFFKPCKSYSLRGPFSALVL